MLAQLYTAWHQGANRISVIHFEFLKDVFGINFLRNENSHVLLLNLNAEIICHHPHICYLIFLRHIFLELLEQIWIVIYEDQVIYINIFTLRFDIECVFRCILDEVLALKILVDLYNTQRFAR